MNKTTTGNPHWRQVTEHGGCEKLLHERPWRVLPHMFCTGCVTCFGQRDIIKFEAKQRLHKMLAHPALLSGNDVACSLRTRDHVETHCSDWAQLLPTGHLNAATQRRPRGDRKKNCPVKTSRADHTEKGELSHCCCINVCCEFRAGSEHYGLCSYKISENSTF